MPAKIFDSVEQYRSYFLALIEKERLAEKQFYMEEMKHLPGQIREKYGRAILHLNAKFKGTYLDFKIYILGRKNMPEHLFKVGDIVLISAGNPLRMNVEATVSAVGNRFIEVMTTSNLFKADEYRLDLYVNDITYKRMEQVLYDLENSVFPVEIILGKQAPAVKQNPVPSLEQLNSIQNQALSRVANSQMVIVHGPPGTGKTTTLAAMVRQLVGKKILVTADSNTAVDNLVQLLEGLDMVRIGHPARIDKNLLQYSLDSRIISHPKYKKVEKLTRQIESLRREQDERYQKPVPSKRRGLSDDDIEAYARRGRSVRGLSAKTLYKMWGWIKLQRQINSLVDKRNALVQTIANEIIDSAQVVLSTNIGVGSDFLYDKRFDYVFIDEGSQAIEPSALIPLIRGKQVILAGDHKQLPPTLKSEKTKNDLQYTFFERMIDLYPYAAIMLRTQYRMNRQICTFPSCKFYDCKLQCAPNVENISISDLLKQLPSFLRNGQSLVFFDIPDYWQEEQKAESVSKMNRNEAQFITGLVQQLLDCGLQTQFLGVITTYKDQEQLLKRLLPPNIEVKSVDGFQGREKEVIVLSLVRSNQEGNIGFLKDYRRLNVAITRAKRLLIIVGNIRTLSQDPVYEDLINYIRTNGAVINLDK